jgi:single-strand DNA-binding protein
MNNVVLMGRLTADPELKQTPSGVPITTFTVAVNRSYVKRGEERQADFIDCVAWRTTAEFISKHFYKGRMISVQGNLQTRTYQDKQSQKHKYCNVVVEKADFCGDKQDNRSEKYFTPAHGKPDIDSNFSQGASEDFRLSNDLDIPF